MSDEENPYRPLEEMRVEPLAVHAGKQHRGPILYFAVAGICAAMLAFPFLIPGSWVVQDDLNPIGLLLVLVSVPAGGLVYRWRSRQWPIDRSVRKRQIAACFSTLLLPAVVAFLTGLRGQGLDMTVLSGVVSLVLMSGILISGTRRSRGVALRLPSSE